MFAATALTLLAPFVAAASQSPVAPARHWPSGAIESARASERVGAKATVCGPVVNVRELSSPAGAAIALDFDDRAPNHDFSVVVAAGHRKRMPKFFVELVRWRLVCVEGPVTSLDGKPQIAATGWKQFTGFGQPAETVPEFGGGVRRLEPGDPGAAQPVREFNPDPEYTGDAKAARITGEITLDCVLDEHGRVGDVRLVKSLDPYLGLDEKAIENAKRWRFKPALRNGVPVATRITIVLEFRLH